MNAAIDAAAASLSKQMTSRISQGQGPQDRHDRPPGRSRGSSIRSHSRVTTRLLLSRRRRHHERSHWPADINIVAGEESGLLSFEAEVEVRPEISIKGQRELRVTIPSPVVNDEEITAQIDRFRETDAVLKEVDRLSWW